MSTPTPPQDRFAYTPQAQSTDEPSPDEETAYSRVMPPIPDPAEVFMRPGYEAPAPPSNPLATGSLYVTIVAIILPIFIIVSLPMAIIALLRAQSEHGVGLQDARGALVLNIVFILAWMMFALWLGIDNIASAFGIA